MNELLEKEPSKSYFESEAKSYEIEKANQRKYTHIDLSKNTKEIDVDDDIIKLLIQEYEKDSSCDFRTLYKVYKLQNYPIDMSYYKGTSYKEGTLIASKVVIRRVLSDKLIPEKQYNMHKHLIAFVKDLKDLQIKPYRYLPLNRRKIKDLLTSGTLTNKDIDFIKQPTYKIFEQPNSNGKYKGTGRYDESFYEVLVLNYKTDLDNLCNILPNTKRSTLSLYKGMCEKLEYNEEKDYYPKGLVKAFKKIYRPNELPPVLKNKEEKSTENRKVEDKAKKTVQLEEKESCNNRYAYIVNFDNTDTKFRYIENYKNEDYIKGYMKGLERVYKETNPRSIVKLLKITEVNY